MIRTILVPLDGSPLAERAVPCASALAGAGGGSLTLLRVVSPPSGAEGERHVQLHEATEYLAMARAQIADHDGVSRVETLAVAGNAPEVILETAQDRHVDAIVMGTHGRSGLGRWLYGSVADHVIHHTAIPVLLVSASCQRAWSLTLEGRTRRILVPLDGSALAQEALPVASDLATTLGGELLLLQVVEPMPYSYAAGYTWVPVDPGALLAESREYLTGVAATLRGRGHQIALLTEVGHAASTIAAVAREQQADVIVMATHGRSGLPRLVLGSVATGVLHQTPAPLFLVRPAAMRLDTDHDRSRIPHLTAA